MRIIAGSAKGRKLKAPRGRNTRPTADRVKEAVFNIVAPHLAGSIFLDLFAGSGAMGIEALSRGAGRAVFMEQDKHALAAIRDNLVLTGFEADSRIYCGDIRKTLPRLEGTAFQIVYVDPPYGKGLGRETLNYLQQYRLLAEGALVLLETAAAEMLPDQEGTLKRLSVRKYGDTQVTVYRYSKG